MRRLAARWTVLREPGLSLAPRRCGSGEGTEVDERPLVRASAFRPRRFSPVLVAFATTLPLGASACRGAEVRPAPTAPSRGDSLTYAFGTVDGGVVSSATLRGRATALLFVTTFDLASQVQAKRLEDLYRTQKPRVNAVAIVLEPPKYAVLARSFGEVLGLSYPVALADDATIHGVGPFGPISSVPSWVILDRESRPVLVHAGPVELRELEDVLQRASR